MSTQSDRQPQAAVRVTRQRRAVQAAMSMQADFISTQDLHAALRERGDSVSLATTYRVLQSMADAGEVDVLRSEDGESIYRQCAAEHHHHHLVCRRCGATVELEAPEIERWTAQTAERHGFTHVDHTIEIVGLCAQCSARRAEDDAPEDRQNDDTAADAGEVRESTA